MSTQVPGFTGEQPPERFNLAKYCLQKSAANLADKTALIICTSKENPEVHQSWTYSQLEQAVLQLAGGLLSAGLKKGDRLFIRMGNSIDYALVFFAANAAGLIPIPASSQLSVFEVEAMLDDSGAAAIASDGTLTLPVIAKGVLVLDKNAIESLKQSSRVQYCDTHKDDPAFLIFTSGTSSLPKGVLHAQRAVWGRRPMYRDWYDLSQDDRLLHTGAFNWTYTLGTGLFDPWANGATSIVYTGEKDIKIWPQLVEIYKPSIVAAVPSLYRQMLKYCDLEIADLSSLRHCLTAGEPQPENIRRLWKEQTGLELFEALGMSEISTYISSSPNSVLKSGAAGKPQSGRCISILPKTGGTNPLVCGQEGVIGVHKSDPGLMLGYWNRDEEQAEAFRGDWFLTGDCAFMDEDGYIWFGGRNDDLMNAMGFRVSPIEVEAKILKHQDVEQIGVCLIEVGENTQIIAGFLVPVAGVKIDIEEILEFARQGLAAYKVPKKLLVVDALPCNASGKLLRKALPLLAQ